MHTVDQHAGAEVVRNDDTRAVDVAIARRHIAYGVESERGMQLVSGHFSSRK